MTNIEKPSTDGKAFPTSISPISELHETARGYARDGLRIFPCKPGTKVPLTEHGFKDASSDIEQIDRWWTAEPHANIALCPEANGWGVVDVEAEGLRDWEVTRLKHAPFETFTNRTPHGGLHIYFAGSLPSKVRLQGLNIDTRGRGGYVLVPPSIVGGKEYNTDLDTIVAPLPDWISELFTERRLSSERFMKMSIRKLILFVASSALGIVAHTGSSEAAQCQVSYDNGSGTFYNGCNYTVWIDYTAHCRNNNYGGNSKGPLKPGQYSDRVAYPDCAISWTWRQY